MKLGSAFFFAILSEASIDNKYYKNLSIECNIDL